MSSGETREAIVAEARAAQAELDLELAKEEPDEAVIDRLLMKTLELGVRDAIVTLEAEKARRANA